MDKSNTQVISAEGTSEVINNIEGAEEKLIFDLDTTEVVSVESTSDTINNIGSAEKMLIFNLDTTDSEYNAIVMRIAGEFQILLNRYLPVSCYLGVTEHGFDLGKSLDSSGAFYGVISDKYIHIKA